MLIGGLVVLLVMALVGTVLATPAVNPETPGAVTQDEDEDPEGPPSADRVLRMLEDLQAADVNVAVTQEVAADYAARYGIGGAMRLLAWADESGRGADDIAALFDSGMGWGEVRRALQEANPELDLHPGIGWIMREARGNGVGRENAPGQNRD